MIGRLFGSDDGCNAHHFGEYTSDGEYEAEAKQRALSMTHSHWIVRVYERYVARCQHSGCTEKKEQWRQVAEEEVDDLTEMYDDDEWVVVSR